MSSLGINRSLSSIAFMRLETKRDVQDEGMTGQIAVLGFDEEREEKDRLNSNSLSDLQLKLVLC